ncbi:MAG: adenylyltransferase/cytidyltransferase family protein [Candidatus Pacearchaeota archaeon]
MTSKKTKKQIVIAASGYFDPIHSGHINYLREAKKLGDKLIVIVNNDKQAKLKKEHYFMPVKERKIILESIKYVDKVFVSIDKDRSVSKSLARIKPDVFAVGMDNYKQHLLEKDICEKLKIKIVDALARKFIIHSSLKQSSSKIVDKFLKKKGVLAEQE